MIIHKADILVPEKNIDYSKWSVIACDQFTSDKNYWQSIYNYTKNCPSTINFIIPEAFIDKTKEFDCCNNILQAVNNKYFSTLKDCYILVDRQTPYHNHRLGLVCSVDLEDYDFCENTKSIIRPSEGTLWERIVPRIDVREKSLIEFPHIILLFDDRKFNILENLYHKKDNFKQVYDFDLSGGGGHITGYMITKDLSSVTQKLLNKDYLKQTFNTTEQLAFIVGDGNHSLATAKTCWEKIKTTLSDEEKQTHNARFCLVEICNINDPGIEFYPIHRVIFNCDKSVINDLKNIYTKPDKVAYKLYYDNNYDEYFLPPNTVEGISLVQNYIEQYLKKYPSSTVDYIHDKDNVISACKGNSLGIFLPVIEKKDIFEYVIKKGVLPKKSFSIGKSVEKRYYLEGKFIK